MAHGGQEVALQPVHLEQGEVRLRQLVDLAVEVAVDLAQLLLHGDQVVEHPVEGVRELLELVTGLDLAADVELARGDRVGDVAEVLDRLDDHVADDHVRGDHRQDRRQQGRGDQERTVAVDRPGRLFHRQVDHDRAGQVARLRHDPLAPGLFAHRVVLDGAGARAAVAVDQAAGLEQDGLDVLVFFPGVSFGLRSPNRRPATWSATAVTPANMGLDALVPP